MEEQLKLLTQVVYVGFMFVIIALIFIGSDIKRKK